MNLKLTCVVCNTVFSAAQRNYKTCSIVCRQKYTPTQRQTYYTHNSVDIIKRVSKNKKILPQTRVCTVCEQSFMGRTGTQCCGNHCRSVLNHQKSMNRYVPKKHQLICIICRRNFTSTYAKDHCSKFCYREHKTRYRRERYATNIQFRLACNLRRRLSLAMHHKQKTGSAVRGLGCSIKELKTHLESQFKPGMSWINYGKCGWHMDHIKPLSNFDLEDRTQLLDACHYTNLQPLWAIENYKKGNRLKPHGNTTNTDVRKLEKNV